MSTFEFENNVHSERLRGTLHVPGATPGDVPTAQADGSLAMAPGGGSQPVSVTLYQDANVDIASGSAVYVSWDTIYDNAYDRNELGNLPAGIGLALVGDTLTTTEAGVWALTLLNVGLPQDDTWEGDITLDNLQLGVQSVPVYPLGTTGDRRMSVSETLALPAGVGISTGFLTITPPTANPYNVSGFYLEIVRLA